MSHNLNLGVIVFLELSRSLDIDLGVDLLLFFLFSFFPLFLSEFKVGSVNGFENIFFWESFIS
jgi:hypothetical protein